MTALQVLIAGHITVSLGATVTGLGAMLTAFYVDNGPRLPVWNLLPPLTFWFLPAAIGLPLIIRAVRRWTGRQPRRRDRDGARC